jgi:hypothetical protein
MSGNLDKTIVLDRLAYLDRRDSKYSLYEAWDKVLEEHYWIPHIMNGAISICHIGCALRQWLVVSGDQQGFVWDDFRADDAGIAPVIDSAGKPLTFAHWYMSWLDERLRKLPRPHFSQLSSLWLKFWRRYATR